MSWYCHSLWTSESLISCTNFILVQTIESACIVVIIVGMILIVIVVGIGVVVVGLDVNIAF